MIKKKISVAHIALTSVSWLLFSGCLIRFIAAYGSLADEIGIHFAGDGSFDIIDRKIYGLYPFLVSLITLLICGVICLLTKRAKIGRVSETGGKLMRFAFTAYIDIFQLLMVLFFSGVWSDCVIRQHPLNTRIPGFILLVLMGLFLVMVIFMIAVRIRCRVKDQ